MPKARLYDAEHFEGDSFTGAVNDADDPVTLNEWLDNREEEEVVDIQYQVDGGTHHILVLYTRG